MRKSARALALVMSLMMICCILPISVIAATSSTMTIASTKVSALAPGVTETEVVAYDKNGDRIAYFDGSGAEGCCE